MTTSVSVWLVLVLALVAANLPFFSQKLFGVILPPSMSEDERVIEVLRELAKGLSNRQIGDMLQVTEGTIKLHVAAIFKLLKVTNRTEAVLVTQKMGLHKK